MREMLIGGIAARARRSACSWAADSRTSRHPAALPAPAVPRGDHPVRDGGGAAASGAGGARPLRDPAARRSAYGLLLYVLWKNRCVPGHGAGVRRHRRERARDPGQRRAGCRSGMPAYEAVRASRAPINRSCTSRSQADVGPKFLAPSRPPRRHHPDPVLAGAERRVDRATCSSRRASPSSCSRRSSAHPRTSSG